jgi:uncharacterized protein GlcG (DUF336 family)
MKQLLWLVAAGLVTIMSSPAGLAQDGLAQFKAMKPELAIKLARATLQACREQGYQVAVAVVDRSGLVQVLIRDQLAGAHTPETARRKAWTAVSFKTDTHTMMEETQAGKPQSGVRFISEAMMVPGGLMVQAAGSIVGGVGVSGAPGGDLDQACAEQGIAAIEEDLLF